MATYLEQLDENVQNEVDGRAKEDWIRRHLPEGVTLRRDQTGAYFLHKKTVRVQVDDLQRLEREMLAARKMDRS